MTIEVSLRERGHARRVKTLLVKQRYERNAKSEPFHSTEAYRTFRKRETNRMRTELARLLSYALTTLLDRHQSWQQ